MNNRKCVNDGCEEYGNKIANNNCMILYNKNLHFCKYYKPEPEKYEYVITVPEGVELRIVYCESVKIPLQELPYICKDKESKASKLGITCIKRESGNDRPAK